MSTFQRGCHESLFCHSLNGFGHLRFSWAPVFDSSEVAKSQSHICRQRASEDSNLGLGGHLKRQQAQPEAGPSLCHAETRAQVHEQDKVRAAGASWGG